MFDVIPLNGGRFISRGKGRHQVRCIDSHEIIFVIKGTLTMFEDDRYFELHAGDFLLLRPGHCHGGLLDYPPDLNFFWLHFLDRQMNTAALLPSGKTADPEQLAIYFQSFMIKQQTTPPDDTGKMLLLELILHELSRSTAAGNSETTLPQLVRKCEELIKLCFHDTTLSLHSAARKLHCNTEYLGKIFHRSHKESFTAFLNRTRVEHSAKLLHETNLSIKEIIAESGFNDPSYFRRIFLRRYAVTPTAFRKFHRTGHYNTE